ncbi:hypothetical protein L2E82_16266 [Cichorium intybus]|uniref:Uncharacterized protein n=1 Tax=Cichorium intybus TaxID=13427 RepID=A0ACB9F4R1_CICIN|nr:hypothetical protein L2E82_16266 [Cichorium intybus]
MLKSYFQLSTLQPLAKPAKNTVVYVQASARYWQLDRQCCKESYRHIIVILHVGTAMVTRNDGILAIGRLGIIFENLFHRSGVVEADRQWLKYGKMTNSSLATSKNYKLLVKMI